MYYILNYLTTQKTKFFKCGLVEFPGSSRMPWNSGVKFEPDKLPKVLKYKAANKLPPEDYVLTSGPQVLVSDKIINIFKTLNFEGIEYYESEIIRPSGEILKGFYTLNITNVVDCMDKAKSKYHYEEFGPAKILWFEELRLNYNQIPGEIKIFRLFERETLIIIHQEVIDVFKSKSITGVKFLPIEEYVDF
jgi:hypothetical protein